MKLLPFIFGLTLIGTTGNLINPAQACEGGGNWCSPTVERSLTRELLNEIHQACVNEVYGNPTLYGGDPRKGYEDYSLIPVVKECEQFVQQRYFL